MVSVGRMPHHVLVLHAELCADYIGSLDQDKQANVKEDQNKHAHLALRSVACEAAWGPFRALVKGI